MRDHVGTDGDRGRQAVGRKQHHDSPSRGIDPGQVLPDDCFEPKHERPSNPMKRRRLLTGVFMATLLAFGLLGCDGGDNKPDENLCRADCGRDLAACVKACGPNDQTCINQCLDTFDLCVDDCHDQGGGN